MFLKQIDLTTALRPSYQPDEDLLFVQDNVGLYEGKFKLAKQQNGQVYLTSHRICYVDKAEPRRHSVALNLADVERYEFYAGFLKSSPKITLVPKARKGASIQSHSRPGLEIRDASSPSSGLGPYRAVTADPQLATTATWVCTICSFSNPISSNFDAATANVHTPLPPCLACGIKPTLTQVLKAAIADATSRQAGPTSETLIPLRARPHSDMADVFPASGPSTPLPASPPRSSDPLSDPDASFQCPRCTFLNHPSLLACEICGAPLISHHPPSEVKEQACVGTDSPGPVLSTSLGVTQMGLDGTDQIKISFRRGGEKIFYERLRGSMIQRKWLLQGAPPILTSRHTDDSSGVGDLLPSGAAGLGDRLKIAGIAGLEHRGKAMRKNNELVIGSAFEDLEALMASAKQIVALAEKFARQVGPTGSNASENALLAESISQLGLITTRDIVGGGGGGSSLYLSELARNLAEFLTDDARGVLRRAGGIVSLVDLWAVFNRVRGGVELVSPTDLERAARLWEELQLPVRLRTFKSGVKVVQARDRTDDTTIRALLAWLRDLHRCQPEREVAWDWRIFGRGVTAQDTAERFGWSIGVAEEELEMAEEKGVLCREEGIEGLKFWENFIETGEWIGRRTEEQEEQEEHNATPQPLQDSGIL